MEINFSQRAFRAPTNKCFSFHFEKFQEWRQKNKGRLVVEIGCGVGLHPIKWGIAHPNDGIIAIERTKQKFKKFENRMNNHSYLTNIFPAHADANILLPQILEVESIDEIFILYPNPYPKSKHKNLRFANSPFTLYLVTLLKKGGLLNFSTNLEIYAQELKQSLQKIQNLELINYHSFVFSSNPKTHFEKKYLNQGQTCIDLTFKRTMTPDP